jgi:competence protein ComEC
LAALLAHATSAPCIGAAERGLACLGLCATLATRRALWPGLVGVALGVAGAAAQQRELATARAWSDAQRLVRLQVVDASWPTSLIVIAKAPDLPAARLRLRGKQVAALRASGRGVAWLAIDPLPARRNPDDRDPRRAALARGVLLSARLLEFAPPAQPARAPALQRLRASIGAQFDRRLSGSSPIWRALLLGDRGQLDTTLSARMRKLGLSHMLSLSGAHVAMLLGMIALLRPGRRIPLWALAPLSAWILLAGSAAALLRAGMMATLLLLGRHWQRGARGDEALALAAWLDLAAHPQRPADIGWWLSYAATYALIRSAGAMRRRRGLGALLVSCAASAATLPWSIAVFGQIVWLSPLINVIVALPFAALMVAGAVATLASVGGEWTAPLDRVLQLVTHLFGALLWLLDRIAPAPWGHPGLNGWSWGATLLLACVAFLPRPRLRWRLSAIAALTLLLHTPLWNRPAAQWWSLDVGQGDAGVLRQGRDWLIVDSGPIGATSTQAERVLLPFLERRNVRGASLAITHGHLDHMGGAGSLLRSGRIATLALARSDSGQAWTHSLLESCGERGVRLRWLARGDSFALGATHLAVLWPPAHGAPQHANDRSLVLLAGPPGARLLLCGDLEREGEAALRAAGAPPGVVALKLAHHGGDTGSELPWLRALSPRWALVSTGRGNRYGHPHPAVLERAASAGIEVWRTDEHGAIELQWRRGGPRLRSQRP